MKNRIAAFLSLFGAACCGLQAQGRGEPGHSIGSVAVRGNLIVMTLDENVLGKATLFNLQHHTLRFAPEKGGYRVESLPFHWEADFGEPLQGSLAGLKNFEFPFSGKNWNSISVGMTGSMTFGEPADGGRGRGGAPGGGAGRGGGLSVERFAELHDAARTIVNTVPAISVFFKPRLSGQRFFKEGADSAMITWSLTEPVGGVQDMTWVPTVNKFQVVLHKDGVIEMSYDDVHAEDAIVGVYPVVTAGVATDLATVPGAENAAVPAHLDLKGIKLAAVDGLFLRARIETRGPVLGESDPQMTSAVYRICVNARKPTGACDQNAKPDEMWTIQAGGFGGRGGGRGGATGPRYSVAGTGASSGVTVEGNTISVEGTLPEGVRAGETIYVSASSEMRGTPALADQVGPEAVKLAGLSSPAVNLASVKKDDGPYPVVYEAFHYIKPPRAMDLTCTVIKALGDRYDMLAYYSDFRIDNPEAGTSSTGPLGGGPEGGKVTGIGANQRNLASYCSEGRFQWQYIQPVWVGSNQMQEYPPADAKDTNLHDVTGYTHQLSLRTTNGRIPPYDYAMSQIGHEMGHRWSAFVSAKVGNETVALGTGSHWVRGLQAPAPFPYQRPTEASAMGGGVWQDNFDGTFTQLDDDYYVPATGYSYLDLYTMGLLAPSEVPDFFILRNLVAAGHDAYGHPIFRADRTKLTIQDVIAAEGPREPDVDHSQKNFNTGMVVVVEHGKTPSKELIDRTNAIAARWEDYFEAVTGHRAHMTTHPR